MFVEYGKCVLFSILVATRCPVIWSAWNVYLRSNNNRVTELALNIKLKFDLFSQKWFNYPNNSWYIHDSSQSYKKLLCLFQLIFCLGLFFQNMNWFVLWYPIDGDLYSNIFGFIVDLCMIYSVIPFDSQNVEIGVSLFDIMWTWIACPFNSMFCCGSRLIETKSNFNTFEIKFWKLLLDIKQIHFYLPRCQGGVCSVTVIIIGNWLDELSSNPGCDCVSHHTKSLEKAWISIIFPPCLWVNRRVQWIILPLYGN